MCAWAGRRQAAASIEISIKRACVFRHRVGIRCLTATCDKWENGKSISSIDTGRASIEHGAKTDPDLARPPRGDHTATQQASPGVLTQGAVHRGRLAAKRLGVRRAAGRGGGFPDDSGIEEERAGGGVGPAGGGAEQEGRGWIRADDVYPEYWRSTH